MLNLDMWFKSVWPPSVSFILFWLHLDFTAGLFDHLFPRAVLFQPLCCTFSIAAGKKCCCYAHSYRSHLTALTTPPLPYVSLPGSQLCHSAICVLVQFLMLRLMGRTVTTVLSSFIFQMVSSLIASSLLIVLAPLCLLSVTAVVQVFLSC